MKNRNYLILGTLMAIVLLIIFARLTIENSIVPGGMYNEISNLYFIIGGCFSFYILAFSDFNQVSSLRLTKYKLRWLMDMSIYLGLIGAFIILLTIWFWNFEWMGKASDTENWVVIFGRLMEVTNFQEYSVVNSKIVDWENITTFERIAGLLSITLCKLLHALLFSFSFYVLSLFIKDSDNADSIKSERRTSAVTTAFTFIMFCLLVSFLVTLPGRGLSVFIYFNKYVFLFLFGVLLFYYFQPSASLSMLTKNLFCDCDETADSIKAQIWAILRAKRIIMCLCFIAIMFIPTAIFGGLTFHTEDSLGIFKLLANATLLMAWGFVLLLFFTALEGKYNYKLFHQNGSMIEDNMFLPKFVALPVILYFLLVVMLFILFNVLF